MAIALDNTGSAAQANAASGMTLSFTIGSGSNRYLLAIFTTERNGSQTHDSMTYNGVAMTKGPDVQNSRSRTSIWWMHEDDLPSGGTYDLVGDVDASQGHDALAAISFTGVEQQAPEATNTGTTDTTSVTTVTANAWVIDGLTTLQGTSGVADGSQVEFHDTASSEGHGMASYLGPVATPASTSMGWTVSGSPSQEAHALVAIAELQSTSLTGTLATTGAMTAAASLNAYPIYSSRAARRNFNTTALQDDDSRDVYVVERETTMLTGEGYDMELNWAGATAISGEATKVYYGNQDVSATVLSGSNSSGTNPQTSKVVTIPQVGYWGRSLVLEWSATVDGSTQTRWLKIYVPRPQDRRLHNGFVDELSTVMIPGEATNPVLLMNGVSAIDTPTNAIWDGAQDLSSTFLSGSADASQNVITGSLLSIPATGYDGKTLVYEWGGSMDSTTQKKWLRIRIARVPR